MTIGIDTIGIEVDELGCSLPVLRYGPSGERRQPTPGLLMVLLRYDESLGLLYSE